MTEVSDRPEVKPALTHPDPEVAAWEASEKEKWDALNAHLVPQFEGVRAHIEHASAKYRVGVVGNARLATIPDPDSPEMRALLKDNLAAKYPDLVEKFRKFKHRNLKDVMPELWEKMAEQSDGLAKTLRKCGVKVIRNEECDYPEGFINLHRGFNGPLNQSIYAGPVYGRITRNILFQTWDAWTVGMAEFAYRQGTIKLFEQNPDLVYYSLPYPEPDISNPGVGSLFLDVAGWRTMPNKHLLFGFGIPDEKLIPKTFDPKVANGITSAGTPLGAQFAKRMLEREGFTHEIMFFDSTLTYHFDCFMMNIVEGKIGLPDLPNYGILGSGLPKCLKDWEILKIPVEDIARGVANAITLGDGRVLVDSRCHETMKRMEKMDIEPVPVKYENLWNFYHSGLDCSDADIWREDDPVKEVPTGPEPIPNP